MPQPVFATSGGIGIVKFGNQALPNGQGTMSYLNLNDRINWWCQPISSGGFDIDFHQLLLGQVVYRGRSVYLSEDWGPWTFSLPFFYDEDTSRGGSGTPLSQVLAQLAMAGEQILTFDNVTGIPVKFSKTRNRKMQVGAPPYLWSFDMEFVGKAGWFVDLSATSIAAQTIVSAPTAAPSGAVAAGGALATGTYTLQYTFVTASGETAASPASSNIVLTTGNQQISVSAVTPLPSWATAVKWYFASGSPTTGFTVQNNGAAFTLNTAGNGTNPPASTPATTFSVTYAGSVFAEPVWTFTVPNNTVAISSFELKNTMSGDDLIINFPGNLPANTAATVTIDAGASSVKDANGTSYDVGGTAFPLCYPPAGQVNTFAATVTPASGVAVGCSISGSVTNRWVL